MQSCNQQQKQQLEMAGTTVPGLVAYKSCAALELAASQLMDKLTQWQLC